MKRGLKGNQSGIADAWLSVIQLRTTKEAQRWP